MTPKSQLSKHVRTTVTTQLENLSHKSYLWEREILTKRTTSTTTKNKYVLTSRSTHFHGDRWESKQGKMFNFDYHHQHHEKFPLNSR